MVFCEEMVKRGWRGLPPKINRVKGQNKDYYKPKFRFFQRFQTIAEQVEEMNRQLGDRLIKIDNDINLDPIQDQYFREKTQLIDQVSRLANGVTDSMTELQEVRESILEMKKFLQQN